MKIAKLIITALLASLLQANADQNVTSHAYKDLKTEISLINSYYLKADQSSEIAQTRFQRGLYVMSELSAIRAIGQFTKADDSIDMYVSKVAGANLKGVMPWNKKMYKERLLDQALELRLLLSVQEEDLQALLREVETQLEQRDLASVNRTLQKIEELINQLTTESKKSKGDRQNKFNEVIAVLKQTKNAILNGVDREEDVSALVEKAGGLVEEIYKSDLLNKEAEQNTNAVASPLSVIPESKSTENIETKDVSPLEEIFKDKEKGFKPYNPVDDKAKDAEKLSVTSFAPARIAKSDLFSENSFKNNEKDNVQADDGLRVTSEQGTPFSTIETMDGRKIRVSRPPQDWPNGQATGYDSIYDDRPGGNLVKEEEIVFERIFNPKGNFTVQEKEGARKERKWDFRINETGGIEERYSLSNLSNYSEFEVKSWILRNKNREVVDKLYGNNLHFSPGNLEEGDYSIEVEGVTGWSSPFTVIASVVR
jgi:hypothetical protein